MIFIQLDVRTGEHPSMAELTADDWCLWTLALLYSARNLTDGFIPSAMLRRISPVEDPESTTAHLIAVGRFRSVDGGVEVVNYLDHNSSRADVEAARDANRQRKAKSRAARSQAPSRDSQRPSRPPPDPVTPESQCDIAVTHTTVTDESQHTYTYTDTYTPTASESDLGELSTGPAAVEVQTETKRDAARLIAERRAAGRTDLRNRGGWVKTTIDALTVGESAGLLDRAIAEHPDATAAELADLIQPLPPAPAAEAPAKPSVPDTCPACEGTAGWLVPDDPDEQGVARCTHPTTPGAPE